MISIYQPSLKGRIWHKAIFLMWGAHTHTYEPKTKIDYSVRLVLVSTNTPSLIQWRRFCHRVEISRARHPSNIFYELPEDWNIVERWRTDTTLGSCLTSSLKHDVAHCLWTKEKNYSVPLVIIILAAAVLEWGKNRCYTIYLLVPPQWQDIVQVLFKVGSPNTYTWVKSKNCPVPDILLTLPLWCNEEASATRLESLGLGVSHLFQVWLSILTSA